jgi:hypothetical protein
VRRSTDKRRAVLDLKRFHATVWPSEKSVGGCADGREAGWKCCAFRGRQRFNRLKASLFDNGVEPAEVIEGSEKRNSFLGAAPFKPNTADR